MDREPLLDSQALTREEKYFRLLIRALEVSAAYKPKFGKGNTAGVSVEEFQMVYGADAFYHWVGLDSPRMYAAHKAAGGMTSIYRQLGTGGEWIFRAILQDSLGLTPAQVSWSYQVPTPTGKPKTLTLDGRVIFDEVKDITARQRLVQWAREMQTGLLLPTEKDYQGLIFEVRQGYKSMDSKRQNADIENAANAHIYGYLPILVVFSTQIDLSLMQRYGNARLALLIGSTNGSALQSTYTFCRAILGYDLASFFESYSERIRIKMEQILEALFEV